MTLHQSGFPQEEEFNYQGLFTSDQKLEHDMDRWLVLHQHVLPLLYLTIVLKGESGLLAQPYGGIAYISWPGNASRNSQEVLEHVLRKRLAWLHFIMAMPWQVELIEAILHNTCVSTSTAVAHFKCMPKIAFY